MKLARALIVAGVAASAASIALACTSFDDAQSPADAGTEPAVDAGADASDAQPAACTYFGGAAVTCPNVRHLEARFADGVPVGFGIEGVANVDPGAGFCTPGFLHAQATVVPDASSTGGRVTRTIDGAFKSVRIAYGLRGPKDLLPGTYVELGCDVWLISAPQVGTVLRLDVRDGQSLNHSATVLGDAAAASDVHLAELDLQQTAEERGRFRKVEATYSWDAPGPQSIQTSIAFDGNAALHPTYPLLAPVTEIRVDCGVTYADQGTGVHVADIDDVVIDACE